ncbi:hypothetical protein BAE44_0002457 [Dichanthelium oligosanthes]|uniref:Uncharacterized protein n=1 Tax=Dichanthelium oligosanthes TaxID=888268 RepID=A0A1E5WGK0_9POAL|nr:hypothetical protein BAE44_0002457 [Dichanthelium oligosanthes]
MTAGDVAPREAPGAVLARAVLAIARGAIGLDGGGAEEAWAAASGWRPARATDEVGHLMHWVQDFSSAGTVTDDEGQRAFALVNKATGQALVNKNIISPSDNQVHVQLAPYTSDVRVDLSMLWTLGAADLGGGFREVRVLRDITQTLNGLLGNVKDGTVVGVHPSRPAAANAVWKFAPVYDHQ